MSQGIVIWPDEASSRRIRGLWEALAARDIPSLATHTHRLHRPHLSLTVAEALPIEAVLGAVGAVPSKSLRLSVESVGVFPPMGTLFLGCVVHDDLLAEQRRVHDLVAPLAHRQWPYFTPGRWVPHITISWALTTEQIAAALPVVLDELPLEGILDHGGAEDGATGDRWPADTDTQSNS